MRSTKKCELLHEYQTLPKREKKKRKDVLKKRGNSQKRLKREKTVISMSVGRVREIKCVLAIEIECILLV